MDTRLKFAKFESSEPFDLMASGASEVDGDVDTSGSGADERVDN